MNNKGVTLIEITVATLILAGVMIPISSLMGFGSKATIKDAKRIAAIQILDKTMRQILAEPYEELAKITKSTEFLLDGPICDKRIALGTVYAEANPGKTGNGFEYNVELRTIYKPVTFKYKPVEVWQENFDDKRPKLSFFGKDETITLNNSVIELKLVVKWKEKLNGKNEVESSVSAKSYRANFSRRTI